MMAISGMVFAFLGDVTAQLAQGWLFVTGKEWPGDTARKCACGICSKVNAEGKIYHLNKLSDFDGTYITGDAGVAIGGGGPGVIAMRNPHGVIIELPSVRQGAKLTIGAQGVEIALKQ